MTNAYTTPGLVCAHHHLYSSLARGMPAPKIAPHNFLSTLENVWWKLDAALDHDMIYWSAALGAAEALLSGTTAIIDHHDSPNCIEGSLDVIHAACTDIGIRVIPCYGVTDRWNNDGKLQEVNTSSPMTQGAELGLAETKRYLLSDRPAMVGVHAAFTCTDETLDTAAHLATEFHTGVHIHVAEGQDDRDAESRLQKYANDDWLIVHGVHLQKPIAGTIVHNPRSNMNNAVGYARPAQWRNRIALGSDGIDSNMMSEFQLAFIAGRADDISFSPDLAWNWLFNGSQLVPDTQNDVVTWNYPHMDSSWHLAYTTSLHVTDVSINNEFVLFEGKLTKVDLEETRRKAEEQSRRLHHALAMSE